MGVYRSKNTMGHENVGQALVTSGQTILEGMLFHLASGAMTPGVTGSTTTTQAEGWSKDWSADPDIPSGANKALNYLIGGDEQMVEMPFRIDAGLASNATLLALVGGNFEVYSDNMTVNLSGTTNPIFQLISISANGTNTGDPDGTYRCWVIIPSAKVQVP